LRARCFRISRLWTSRPWHAGLAITALAIGIGANTGVFSVVDALLLRLLPFHEPDRLALLQQFIPPHDSAKEFHEWRQQSSFLADAALFEENDVNLGGARVASRAHVAQISWNFVSVLDTQPVLGCGFEPEDEVDGTGWGLPGRNAVAVIGYGLWQQLFAGDPKALGATVRIDGIPLIVIGVAPRGFDYPGKAALWKPAAFSRGNNGWGTDARLTGRFLQTLIDGAKPVDMIASVGLVMFLALIASVSIWAASRRIATLDIVAILRAY
jgi:putative ABC transport system permease protein